MSNTLGVGFLGKVYENALFIGLNKDGLKAEKQKKIAVTYEGIVVGDYFADLLVNDKVIVEVKAIKVIEEIHKAQLLNYLKATGYRVGFDSKFWNATHGHQKNGFMISHLCLSVFICG